MAQRIEEDLRGLAANGVVVTWGDERPDTSDPAEFVTDLHAGAPLFRAESVATIQVGKKQLKFKIRSIPKTELEEGMKLLRPKASYLKDAYGKLLRDEQGRLVEDEDSPAKTAWYLQFGYMKVLLGLAEITLRDRAGAVVWQAPGTEGVRDMRAAIQALKDSQIATQHVEDLNRAIDALTQLQSDESAEALMGN